MTPAAIALAVIQYGPSVLPLLQQLGEWAKAGKQEVSPEDIAKLIEYGKKTSADYLKAVGLTEPAKQ